MMGGVPKVASSYARPITPSPLLPVPSTGQSDEALMKDLLKSQAPPLPPGKARRRKDKATLAASREQPLDKSKGFGARR
jgi:hypothetical protein